MAVDDKNARRSLHPALAASLSLALAALPLPALAAGAEDPGTRVARVLKQVPLIDGHNDWPEVLSEREGDGRWTIDLRDLRSRPGRYNTDIARLRRGGAGAIFWSVFVSSAKPGAEQVQETLEQIDLVKSMVARFPGDFALARTAADVRRIHRDGKIASMIGVEGGNQINESLSVLRSYHALGAGYLTLTHSRTISWADSATDGPRHGGLTPFGEKVVRDGRGNVQWSAYPNRFMNSLIIAITSTVLAVSMGTITAYGFSRFRVKGEGDLLFFILSTRMLPPVVVAIPMFLMYRVVGLNDTHLGLIILYTAFNLSFSVWLMKGFIDEIPREYEEAALVDGYTRMEAFFKIVIPEAATGIAATAVFCFITAWNEYAFALIMTNRRAQTAPPFIPSQVGSGLPDWTVIAAGTFLFLLPVAIFTFLLRNHLLRGMSFGAIRK